MSNAVYDTMTVRIVADAGKEYGYQLKGKALKFAGFTAVYSAFKEKDEDEENEEGTLPNLTEGEPLELKELKGEQKFTKPPARYTDATLIKALEENGIGRPSTYASIIGVIGKRHYTEKEDKFFVPTELGLIVTDHLCKYFPDILNIDFTAEMEERLDTIEEGKAAWVKVIKDFYPNFEKALTAASGGERVKMATVESDEVCSKCGKKMVFREGKYGKFLACPGYPACKNIMSIDKPVSACPKCKKDIFKKRSKKGKTFFGCAGYPKCDFISWDLPAPILCPECDSGMKVLNRGSLYMCTKCSCKQEVTS
jgi:DNA topoisomerase-1